MVKLGLKDYTVGWISALPSELSAARCMLDENHEKLPTPTDPNIYTFGRIGEHNTVLACLPAGVTGTVSTATLAMRMSSTFPSLKFGLLVGIGGGIPSDEVDIQLGDIVVSEPDGTCGGVVQYLFGKQRPGEFERKGSLNRPPDILLSAIATLKSNHDLEYPKLLQYQKEMLERYPRRRQIAAYQGIERDLLYQYDYHHSTSSSASKCEACDPSKLISRTPRQEIDGVTIPNIHYGLIASGDWVMKDGEMREKLRKELKVKCFEMEAAGLMDNFPCLVIRGICDYSDSHKNDIWQPYAAAIAAAYAKELLSAIPGTAVGGLLSAEKKMSNSNVHWFLPRSSTPLFTGRASILQTLDEKLSAPTENDISLKPKVFVLVGMGGVGKSEVAIKFAEIHRQRFWGVFWIDASSRENAALSFENIAIHCKLQAQRSKNKDKDRTPPETNKKDFQAAVLNWLANIQHPWLLILDNCDNLNTDYALNFPSGGRGRILMTTRVLECADYQTVGCETFDGMPQEDVIDLLFKACKVKPEGREIKMEAAKAVVNLLGHHTLAIIQAGAYINRRFCAIEEYPNVYEKQRRSLLEYHSSQLQSTYGDVYTTFEVSAIALQSSEDPAAKQALALMNVLGFMHREAIQEDIFVRALEHAQCLLEDETEQPNEFGEPSTDGFTDHNWSQDMMYSKEHSKGLVEYSLKRWHIEKAFSTGLLSLKTIHPTPFRAARAQLEQLSLINVELKSGDISIHPIIHDWARERMNFLDQKKAWQSTGSILALSALGNLGYRNFIRSFLRHTFVLRRYEPEHKIATTFENYVDDNNAVRIFSRLNWYIDMHRFMAGIHVPSYISLTFLKENRIKA